MERVISSWVMPITTPEVVVRAAIILMFVSLLERGILLEQVQQSTLFLEEQVPTALAETLSLRQVLPIRERELLVIILQPI